MRFPDQRVSVLATCNIASARATELAEGVADVWLERAGLGPRAMSQAPEDRPKSAAPSDAQLEEYTGHYATPELTSTWTVTVVDHKLWLRIRKGDGVALVPSGTDRFLFRGGTALTFARNPTSQAVVGIRLDNSGVRNFRLERTSAVSNSR